MRTALGFAIHEEGTIRFHNRVCVLAVEELKKKILDEGHKTPHSIHLRGNKLYKDLKHTFWWSNIKQEVADYLAKWLTCQRVMVEYQRLVGLLQSLDASEWKSDLLSMDFTVGLAALTQKENNAIWVIVNQLTKTAHFIAMENTWTLDRLSQPYPKEIIRLHRVPSSIVSLSRH